MNKCIILCMCCNEPHYVRERVIISNTWGRHVLNGEYDNLDLWFYTSGNTTSIDIDNHIIYVNTDDGMHNTWEKTRLTFEILNKYFDYDFIFRTNCSTVVNCQVLSIFVNTLDKTTEDTWSLLHTTYLNKSCITFWDFFSLWGWAILFSKVTISHIFEALQYSEIIYENNKQYLQIGNNDPCIIKDIIKFILNNKYPVTDDTVFGYLLYMYYRHNNDDFTNHFKQISILFYKTKKNNEIFFGYDRAYDVLNIDYFSKCICVRVKDDNISAYYSIEAKAQTEQSICELSQLYDIKMNDDIIQSAIDYIYNKSTWNGEFAYYVIIR